MKNGESLNAYSTKLIEIVNQRRKLGEDVTKQKVAENIPRNLPRKFEHIVAAIEEANYSSDAIDELLGSLQSHEDQMKRFDNQGSI